MSQDYFIKLTSITNDIIHVSYQAIMAMREGSGNTGISMFSGQVITVKESVHQIKDLINKASQYKIKLD